MALSGAVWVGFVLVHMLGNLQMFMGAEQINLYAHKLKTLPFGLLWVTRAILLAAGGIHVSMGVLLKLENKKARPQNNAQERVSQASYASRTMFLSGMVLLSFIVFHLLHFTLRVIYAYDAVLPPYSLQSGEVVFDVYQMVIAGFSHLWVVLVYLASMSILCLHLSHAFSSMFQTMGLNNESLRPWLHRLAIAYGWLLLIGFASVPVSVYLGWIY